MQNSEEMRGDEWGNDVKNNTPSQLELELKPLGHQYDSTVMLIWVAFELDLCIER